MNLIHYRKAYYAFSTILIIASLVGLWRWGLNFGIDFKGGSLLEIEYKDTRPDQGTVKQKMREAGIEEVTIQSVGGKGYILRFKEIDVAGHQKFLDTLGRDTFEEKRFESIGSIIGKELREKTGVSTVLVLVGVLFYIAWAFRRVSRPISSFRYGFLAIVAMLHDVIIVLGSFSLLGYFLRVEIGIPFVAVLLTVLGYSVQDTIVVFDRIRENLTRLHLENFETLVGMSIQQTMARSLNTSFTTLAALAAIFFFGGETLRSFSLALLVGITIGTYSSIFIASPLLVTFQQKKLFNLF